MLKAIAQRGPDCFGYQVWGMRLPNTAFELLINHKVDKHISREIEEITMPSGHWHQMVGLVNFRGIPTTENFGNDQETIQPFGNGHLSVVHNGLLHNDRAMYLKYGWKNITSHIQDVDSYTFVHALDRDQDSAVGMLKEVQGSFALAAFDARRGKLWLARNFRGLFLASESDGAIEPRTLWFASEAQALAEVTPSLPWELPLNGALIFDLTRSNFSSPAEVPLHRMHHRVLPLIPHKISTSAIVVLSAGLDSTVCATMACRSGKYERVHLMHFQYGCRAELKEQQAFEKIYAYLKDKYPEVKITQSIEGLDFIKRLGGSTLTDHSLEVAEGEKGVETDNEWVPARNLVMISLAAAYCDRHQIDDIILGLNMEEGCLTDHENNLIRMADGTTKLPSDVVKGDKLIAWDEENKRMSKTKVVKTVSFESENVYSFTVHSGRKWANRVEQPKTYEATMGHHWYVKHTGWMELHDIQVGDVILHMQETKQIERNTHNNPFKGKSRSGADNPMTGHVRGRKCHCGIKHRAPTSEVLSASVKKAYEDPNLRAFQSFNTRTRFENMSDKDRAIFAQSISRGALAAQPERLLRTGYSHHSQTPANRRAMVKRNRDMIESGTLNPATLKNRTMNGLEKKFSDVFKKHAPTIRYVGDGQVWFTAANGKKMNPDFIDTENRLVIEVTESSGYFHGAQKKRRRREAFEKLGWNFTFLTDKDLKPAALHDTISLVKGLANGMTVLSKRKLPGTKTVSDFTCEPHHNYFVGKSGMLSHNSVFADNSIEFYQRMESALAIGAKSSPRMVMPLGNMMKRHILKKGIEVEAPLDLSWSCYHGRKLRCGRCGPCVMRIQAYRANGLNDNPELYEPGSII